MVNISRASEPPRTPHRSEKICEPGEPRAIQVLKYFARVEDTVSSLLRVLQIATIPPPLPHCSTRHRHRYLDTREKGCVGRKCSLLVAGTDVVGNVSLFPHCCFPTEISWPRIAINCDGAAAILLYILLTVLSLRERAGIIFYEANFVLYMGHQNLSTVHSIH